MFSNSELRGSVEVSDAAYDELVGAFGEPSLVAGGFRWSVVKVGTGRCAVIEMSFPVTGQGRVQHPATVWVFDPDAVGISTFNSGEVDSPEGLLWLRGEVRRLREGPRAAL